jgi:hypothetical protein
MTDVTAQVVRGLNQVPTGPPPQRDRSIIVPVHTWPLQGWTLPPRQQYNYVRDPPVDQSGALQFVTADVAPSTHEFILSIDALDIPKLVAVSWPTSINPSAKAPLPFLVFVRPPPNQGRPPKYYEAAGQSYPYGWDYLFYEFWGYLNYRADPLTKKDERWMGGKANIQLLHRPLNELDEKFSFGLPYQIQESGSPVVLVFPLVGPSGMGALSGANGVQDILLGVQRIIHQRAGVSPVTALGWIALAAFSYATEEVTSFLLQDPKSPAIQELYLFDPPDSGGQVVKRAKQWLDSAQPGSPRAVRLYTQQLFGGTEIGKALGMKGPVESATGFFRESPDRRFSVVYAPTAAWSKAQDAARKTEYAAATQELAHMFEQAEKPGDPLAFNNAFAAQGVLDDQKDYDASNIIRPYDYDAAHLLVPATMLTDALRRRVTSPTP